MITISSSFHFQKSSVHKKVMPRYYFITWYNMAVIRAEGSALHPFINKPHPLCVHAAKIPLKLESTVKQAKIAQRADEDSSIFMGSQLLNF